MHRKPWPIVILALLHLLEPLPKIVLYAYRTDTDIFVFTQKFFEHENFVYALEFFLLFPIAGFAIWMVKRWSLPVFILIEGYVLFTQIRGHQEIPDVVSLPLISLFIVLNISVVTYFLIPAVRVAYMDPKLRWWESKTRYKVDMNAKFEDESGIHDIKLSDIAEGGAYVLSDMNTDLKRHGYISFTHLNFSLKIEGEIVYFGKPGVSEFGFKFNNLDPKTNKDIKKLMRAIKKQGAESTRPTDIWYKDFKKWTAELFTTGKGLIPEIRRQDNKKARKL